MIRTLIGILSIPKYLSSIFALLFFGGLCLFGFPQPMVDDLFFIGAGLNLAQGGEFSNPMLERQHFPGTLYFVHPPLHSYAVAGWLKIFGISTFSLIGFQMVMYVLICWSAIRILRQYQAPPSLEWLLPLGVATAFLSIGLRPEPLSAALTMLGFALLECFGSGSVVVFGGFLLMFLGASVASRLSFFSAAMALAAFVRLLRDGMPLGRLCKLAGTAMLLALTGFSVMIGFHFKQFYEVYHFHASGRVGANIVGLLFRFLGRLLGMTQLPLVFLWLATLPLLWKLRLKDKDLFCLGGFVSAAFFGLALIGGLGHGAIWYLIFSLFTLTIVYSRQTTPARFRLAQLLLAAVLIFANSRNFTRALGAATGHIMADGGTPIPDDSSRPTSAHPLLIDAATARYIFNYHLPDGVLDWSFAAPFPGELATDTALLPDDIFLLGPDSMDNLNKKLHLKKPTPKWSPLGSARWSFPEHPQWGYVVYAKDCLNAESSLNQKLKE